MLYHRSICCLMALTVGCASPEPSDETHASTADIAHMGLSDRDFSDRERSQGDSAEVGHTDTGLSDEEPIMHIAFSIHAEGRDYASAPAMIPHTAQLTEVADLAEHYGLRLSFEADGALIRASNAFSGRFFDDMMSRGHVVSVHADMGFNQTYHEFRAELSRLRFEAAIAGIDAELVSGICSAHNFVEIAQAAGFSAITGAVEYCALALADTPEPYDTGFSPATCHDPYPEDMAARIAPWTMHVDHDWTEHHEDGSVVMLAIGSGVLDVDAYFEQLDEAIALAEPGRINVFKGTLSLGARPDLESLDSMFERLRDEYLSTGQAVPATTRELYDAYRVVDAG